MFPVTDLEFPRHVHRWGGVYLRVENAADCMKALADGWALLPPQTQPVEAPSEPELPTKKGGRPVRP